MNSVTEICVPVNDVNDDSVLVTELLAEDMSPVEAEADIVCIETSKATLNLSTPAAGFVHFLVEAGQEVPNGTVLALVAQDTADFAAYQARPAAAAQKTTPPPVMPPAAEASQELRLTKAAAGLLSSKGISAAELGLSGLVRVEDVLAKLQQETPVAAPPENRDAAPVKGMPQRTLSKSKKSEIAFLRDANAGALVSQVSVLVPTNGLFKKAANDLRLAKQFSARIIFEVSRLLQKYPDLQSVYDNGGLYQYPETHIGYALCIDKGLKVPVFHHCARMSLDEIIQAKDAFIEKYVSNALSPEDLAGGAFTISDLSSTGCWLFNPLLNYRQSAILGIGGENPRGDAYPLVLAFDHRVTDGMTAAAFLNDLKDRLCSHERLLLPDSLPEAGCAAAQETSKIEAAEAEKELPVCSKCYRDIDELTGMEHYLVQTIDRSGDVQLVCTICMEGW